MSYEYTQSAAQAMFETLCTALDNRSWKYKRDDEDLVVTFCVNGDDLPMDFIVMVNKDVPFVQVFSRLPFSFPEDKRVDGAIAVAVANWGYVNGCFEYDIAGGTVTFKLAQCFTDSTIGDQCFQYMFSVSCNMVDEYNDKFLSLSKGIMSLTDFLAKEKEN